MITDPDNPVKRAYELQYSYQFHEMREFERSHRGIGNFQRTVVPKTEHLAYCEELSNHNEYCDGFDDDFLLDQYGNFRPSRRNSRDEREGIQRKYPKWCFCAEDGQSGNLKVDWRRPDLLERKENFWPMDTKNLIAFENSMQIF